MSGIELFYGNLGNGNDTVITNNNVRIGSVGANLLGLNGGGGINSFIADYSGLLQGGIVPGRVTVDQYSGYHLVTVIPASGAGYQYTLNNFAIFDLTGTSGDDRMDGSNGGNDILRGGDGQDALAGFAGDDQLFGGDGNDDLVGGSGTDILNGGSGSDILIGGNGDDSYFVDIGDVISEANSGGNDRAFASTNYTLGNGVFVETLSTDNDAGLVAINLFGNDLANTIIGNSGDNILYGFGGHDVLNGGQGNDILAGGIGDDRMIGGSGANQYIGGTGNDIYVVDASTPTEAVLQTLFEAAGEGIDEVRVSAGVFSLEWFGSSELEGLTVTDNAAHTAIGNAFGNVITGGSGADDLFGRAGNDRLIGGVGSANTMLGQEGDDTYVVAAAGDSVIEFAGEGTDTVETALASFVLRDHVENLTYTGTSNFTGIGSSDANTLRGGIGADFLSGLDGDDSIIGGSGADTLLGGNGTDLFRYEGGETGFDRILDFVSGTDKIALRSAFFTPTGTVDFVSGGSVVATSANSTILYDTNTGIVWYDDDGTGAGAAVAIAQLNPGQTFAAGDFLFY